MPKEILFLFIFGFAFIVFIVIIRGIINAVRSTFSRASLIGVIVGVITALLARAKAPKEEEREKHISPTDDARGDAAWIICPYCGSKNRSSEVKCRNCGASL
jgi:hypothetical protein